MALILSVMLPVFGVRMLALALRMALPFLSRWNLEFFSASSRANRSRLGTACMVKDGAPSLAAALLIRGVSQPSSRYGVLSTSPHVIMGDSPGAI